MEAGNSCSHSSRSVRGELKEISAAVIAGAGTHQWAVLSKLIHPLVRFHLKEHPVFRIMPPAGYHVLKPMRLQLPDISCLNLHTLFRKHVIMALITSATQRHIFLIKHTVVSAYGKTQAWSVVFSTVLRLRLTFQFLNTALC